MVAIYILRDANHWIQNLKTVFCIQDELDPGGGGEYFRNFWVGWAAGTLEPLTYTRASSAEFCYSILE